MKRHNSEVVDNSDDLEMKPLGSGNEVGRSCHIIRFKGKVIMLDCGVHPAYTGFSALPYFLNDEVDCSKIDLMLVTHFHLDHAAALPYFLMKTSFRGRCYMTHPTKAIYKLILQDYVKVSQLASSDSVLYTEAELLKSMEKIIPVNYHQDIHHNGIKFRALNAGHVLGAAMFQIEVAGVKILYTGDYSRRDDRHLMAAELPEEKPDILIVEATYGVQTHQSIDEREKRLTETVHTIVQRGGRCLLPVFALGRAQELLLILDEYWDNNPSLHSIPIYYASALAKKCMTVYQTYTNMMNKRISRDAHMRATRPFVFKHVMNLQGIDHFEDYGPCVVMASPGMLQNGLSRDLFEAWCTDKKNGIILPGYSVEHTLAKIILSEPSDIMTLSGLRVPLKMSVHEISFSAHADYAETSEFIQALMPPHVILVHGDGQQMWRLADKLRRTYRNEEVKVHTPKNCQSVFLPFQAQKLAKIVGRLAERPLQDGGRQSGLVVRKDFNYHIMSTEDLSNFTPLASTTIKQTLKVPFFQKFSVFKHFVAQMYHVQMEQPVEIIKVVRPALTSKENTATPDATAPTADTTTATDTDTATATATATTATATVTNDTSGSSSSDNEGGSNTNDNDGSSKEESAVNEEDSSKGDPGVIRVKKEQPDDDFDEVPQPVAMIHGKASNESESESEDKTGRNSVDELEKKDAMETDLDTKDSAMKGKFTDAPETQVDDSDLALLVHFGSVRVMNRPGHLIFEWRSDPVKDMIADSLICVAMSIEANPGSAKEIGVTACAKQEKGEFDLTWYLKQHFEVNNNTENHTLRVTSVTGTATVNLKTMEVESEDEVMRERVETMIQRATGAAPR